MTWTGNAFTDLAATAELYRDGTRLAVRTSALHQAKTRGRPVAEVIADLALNRLATPSKATVADVGCGRGTSSRILIERLQPRALALVDASMAMLSDARGRVEPAIQAGACTAVAYLRADFHALPFPDASCDLVVAAFCLYHAPDPRPAITELGRTLASGGTAILVTKSADSYRALDDLLAGTGLDPGAAQRPSLYTSAHSGNLADLVAPIIPVTHIEHEQHEFVFAGLDHVAAYLATNPKYHLPAELSGRPEAIAAALHRHTRERPMRALSTITYVVATRSRRT
ncbi:Methyltransferase domain-containing protein [Sinosporangium album]|uniref:Methyltransferase domain-containing protein n=1 Tax=Sinosporangium album TaxID=504805 RepID=A0A1G7XIQ7_9ACTN|nr:class I SAM-dependent methyltransferase [Sinosporangium album]SDG84017.1 Methyltransferase domain-containing protein [Sinosporangium album]